MRKKIRFNIVDIKEYIKIMIARRRNIDKIIKIWNEYSISTNLHLHRLRWYNVVYCNNSKSKEDILRIMGMDSFFYSFYSATMHEYYLISERYLYFDNNDDSWHTFNNLNDKKCPIDLTIVAKQIFKFYENMLETVKEDPHRPITMDEVFNKFFQRI